MHIYKNNFFFSLIHSDERLNKITMETFETIFQCQTKVQNTSSVKKKWLLPSLKYACVCGQVQSTNFLFNPMKKSWMFSEDLYPLSTLGKLTVIKNWNHGTDGTTSITPDLQGASLRADGLQGAGFSYNFVSGRQINFKVL